MKTAEAVVLVTRKEEVGRSGGAQLSSDEELEFGT